LDGAGCAALTGSRYRSLKNGTGGRAGHWSAEGDLKMSTKFNPAPIDKHAADPKEAA